MNIRSMVAADLPAVGILAGKLVRMHYAYDPERFMKPVDPERGYARWLGTQLEHEEVILIVATEVPPEAGRLPAWQSGDEQGILGYVYARLEPRNYNELLEACAKLHDIYVDERARRRGVGEALLTETFRRAKGKGAPRVILDTAAKNETAQRLFQRFGFRTTMLEMTRELP
jgi:ribosomal protein S18 acetylase RimI-like enzyme